MPKQVTLPQAATNNMSGTAMQHVPDNVSPAYHFVFDDPAINDQLHLGTPGLPTRSSRPEPASDDADVTTSISGIERCDRLHQCPGRLGIGMNLTAETGL
jgi:hypothetical protein